MALLLRMGGVPARVSTGFTTGTYDQATKQWLVTDVDAHAWVEAWFPHYGWVTFDPTPASAPARGAGSVDVERPFLGPGQSRIGPTKHASTPAGTSGGGLRGARRGLDRHRPAGDPGGARGAARRSRSSPGAATPRSVPTRCSPSSSARWPGAGARSPTA